MEGDGRQVQTEQGWGGRGAEGQGQPGRVELAQTDQQQCWQKAQQAPVPLMHFHTDFLHSVHVSFYFYTWIVARMEKKKGR